MPPPLRRSLVALIPKPGPGQPREEGGAAITKPNAFESSRDARIDNTPPELGHWSRGLNAPMRLRCAGLSCAVHLESAAAHVEAEPLDGGAQREGARAELRFVLVPWRGGGAVTGVVRLSPSFPSH